MGYKYPATFVTFDLILKTASLVLGVCCGDKARTGVANARVYEFGIPASGGAEAL